MKSLKELDESVAIAKRMLAAFRAGKNTDVPAIEQHLKHIFDTGRGKSDDQIWRDIRAAITTEVLDVYNTDSDWYVFANDQRLNNVRRLLIEFGVSAIQLQGLITIAFHGVHFNNGGRHLFKTSDGLAVNMRLTELRGIKVEHLHLPVPVLVLEVPALLRMQAKMMHGDATVETLMVFESSNPRAWHIMVNGIMPNGDVARTGYVVPLVEGDTSEQALERWEDKIRNHPEAVTVSVIGALESLTTVWRWLMNVMVYATTPDAEAEHIIGNPEAAAIWRRIQKLPKISAKRDELKKRLKSMDQQPQILLGKSTILTPQLRAMLQHHQDGTGEGLKVRTLVSGHWQRFACGPGGLERKWKYRSPFWRGAEDLPVAPATDHVLA